VPVVAQRVKAPPRGGTGGSRWGAQGTGPKAKGKGAGRFSDFDGSRRVSLKGFYAGSTTDGIDAPLNSGQFHPLGIRRHGRHTVGSFLIQTSLSVKVNRNSTLSLSIIRIQFRPVRPVDGMSETK
jgi:hypothetical protein